MKGAVTVALVLLAGGLLAHLLLTDPGYVSVRIGRTLFETTVPVALLLLFGGLALLGLLLRAVTMRRRIARLGTERRQRHARRDAQLGIVELAAGNWKRAEDLLVRSAEESESPAANFLLAARAADLLDAPERRDQWLTRAQEYAPEQRAAPLVTLAEMQMRRGQDAAALRTLEQLDASGDLNSRGLELLARLYQKLGRGAELHSLLPRLRDARELPQERLDDLLAQAQLEALRSAGEGRDPGALEKAWSGLPRSLRKLPQARLQYARAAMACGDHQGAEKVLRELIEEDADVAAVRAYGDLQLANPLLPIEQAEGWLARSPKDPELLSSCARLCLRAELFGKAIAYLEASNAIRPSAESSLLLAELFGQMGEPERAMAVLRDYATRAVGRRLHVPRLRLPRR